MTIADRTDDPPTYRGYHPETDTYHAHHEGDGSLCHVVYRTVAAVTGVDASRRELFPEFRNLDALDDLFAGERSSGRPTDRATFYTDACEVTVYRNGHVVVRTLDGEA